MSLPDLIWVNVSRCVCSMKCSCQAKRDDLSHTNLSRKKRWRYAAAAINEAVFIMAKRWWAGRWFTRLALLAGLVAQGALAASLEEVRAAAQKGDAQAQYQLGTAYGHGKGHAGEKLPADLKLAAYWFLQAAKQGHAGAQTDLGYAYGSGRGVPMNVTQAAFWYRKAAEQGNAAAQTNLGLAYINGSGVRSDPVQAVPWLRKAAEQGYASAQANLGVIYTIGNGVPQDLKQAFLWSEKAARQGNITGQYNLAVIYCDANYARLRGTKQDYAQGAQWFERAAGQGHVQAQTNLGALYANGKGVARDLHKAYFWFYLAINGGDNSATESRDLVASYLKPDEIFAIQQQALAWRPKKS